MTVYYGTINAEADYDHSGKPVKIACTNSYISINSATYGDNCKNLGYSTNCINDVSSCFDQTSNLAAACDKKNYCEYEIHWEIIGDPAYKCSKDYIYSYMCIQITHSPSMNPTPHPTGRTNTPTSSTNPPTYNPSFYPSKYPTNYPTFNPSNPTNYPTSIPTNYPTLFPTLNPAPGLHVTMSHLKSTKSHISTTIKTQSSYPNTQTTTFPFDQNTLSHNQNTHTIYLIALCGFVLFTLILVCCFVMIRLLGPQYKKRLQKQQEIQESTHNNFDYIQLGDCAPLQRNNETPNGNTPQHIITPQYITPITPSTPTLNTPNIVTQGGPEMDILNESFSTQGGPEMDLLNEDENDYVDNGEDDNNDDIYAKPNAHTKRVTAGQELNVIHFYYMDDIDQQANEYNHKELYHEKQKWEMCLLHALNGLLQSKIFTIKSMDKICKELAPQKLINPHKSVLGNYDANVLIVALRKMNIDVEWFDIRNVKELDLTNDEFLNFLEGNNRIFVGFIVNKPCTTLKMFNRRHWIAIKQINGIWYNLDSKLKEPKSYENAKELSVYLAHSLKENKTELMICRKKKSKQSVEMKVSLQW